MAFNITPVLGGNFELTEAVPSVQLGSRVMGSDAHEYLYCQANGAIASGVATILTETGFQQATGAGAWTAPVVTGGVPDNYYAWFRETAFP